MCFAGAAFDVGAAFSASLPSASITAHRSKVIITSGSRVGRGRVLVSVQDSFEANRPLVSITTLNRLEGTWS